MLSFLLVFGSYVWFMFSDVNFGGAVLLMCSLSFSCGI